MSFMSYSRQHVSAGSRHKAGPEGHNMLIARAGLEGRLVC